MPSLVLTVLCFAFSLMVLFFLAAPPNPGGWTEHCAILDRFLISSYVLLSPWSSHSAYIHTYMHTYIHTHIHRWVQCMWHVDTFCAHMLLKVLNSPHAPPWAPLNPPTSSSAWRTSVPSSVYARRYRQWCHCQAAHNDIQTGSQRLHMLGEWAHAYKVGTDAGRTNS